MAATIAVTGSVVGCGSSTPDPTAKSTPSPTASPTPSPAAVSDFAGPYIVRYDDGAVNYWVVKSRGATCAEISATQPFAWNEVAELSGTQWTLDLLTPETIECDDGTLLAATEAYTWDARSLRGVYTSAVANDVTADLAEGCGYKVGDVTETTPFTLAKRPDQGSPTPTATPTRGKVNTFSGELAVQVGSHRHPAPAGETWLQHTSKFDP